MALRRSYGLVLLVGLLLTIYTFTSSGRLHIVDEASLFAVTESLALRGRFDTNAIAWSQWVNSPGEVLGDFGPDGDVYSKKGVGPAVVAVAWYQLLRVISRLNIAIGLLQGTLLWNGFVTALTAAHVWLAAVRLGYEDRTGAALALLFGLATIAWPYANMYFGEPLSAFGLFLGFYGLLSWIITRRTRWAIVGGIGAALAVVTVIANLLLVALLAGYGLAAILFMSKTPSRKPTDTDMAEDEEPDNPLTVAVQGMALFAIPVLIGGFLLLWYNHIRFGSAVNTGYHFGGGEGFTTPILEGLYGLVLSPYRGVFWFTPLFVASAVAYVPFLKRHKYEAILIAALSITLLLLYSAWWMWWAGFAWGPRFLVPLAAFWTLLLAPFVSQLDRRITSAWKSSNHDWKTLARSPGITGWSFIVLIAISVIVQISAVTVNFVNYEILLRSLYPTDWSDPLQFGPPAVGLGDIFNSPVVGQFKLMKRGFIANTDLAWLWQDGNIQMLVLIVGGAVLLTMLALFYGWWVTANNEEARLPSRPVRLLAVVLPLLFVGLWVSEVSRHPHYGDVDRGYRAVISEICGQATADDVVVTVAPFAYQIPMNWMGTECKEAPPIFGYAPNSLEHDEAQKVMSRVLTENKRIWFVTGGLPPNDPDNMLERLLADTSYKAMDTWYEDFRLLAYATPLGLEDVVQRDFNIPLVGSRTSQITMLGTRIPQVVEAGDTIPVELHFRIEGPNEVNLRWFVQMLTTEGYPVALLDTAPDDGYTPFSALPFQEELIERAGLFLSPDIPGGEYQIIAGLYNPDSPEQERLARPDGADFVRLGTLTVE